MTPDGKSADDSDNQIDRRGGPDYARLVEIGIALSAEHDHKRLLETILIEAKSMCHADGGTLYLSGNPVERDGEMVFEPEGDGKFLAFEIMRTDSLNIAKGGTTGEDIPPASHNARNALKRGLIQGIWDRREFRRNLHKSLMTMGGRNLYYR